MANTTHHESNTRELPLSLDSVRKKVLRVVNKVDNEAKEFLTTYSGYPEPNKNWKSTTEKACSQVGKTSHDLHSFDDLETILVKVRVNQAMPLSEYNELRRMLECRKLFDYITRQLCSELVHVYENQVEKFCISFHQETKRQDLESVNDYETVIVNCHQRIVENMIKVEDDLEEVEEIRRKSVMNYIENYGKVLENMESVCSALEEVCRLIRKRVASDAEYPQNIQEEINFYNRQLLDLKKLNRELEEEQNGDGKRLRRTTGNLAKTEMQLKSTRAEVGLFRQRQRNVEDNRSTLEATLRQKLKERQEIKEKMKKKDNAASVNSRLSAQSEELQTQIHTIEAKMRQMEVQLESLRAEEVKVVQVMEKQSEQVESSRRKRDDASDQVRSHEEQLKAIDREVELHEAKIEALKIIRKVKMHTDTLKKIHHNGYDPEHALEIKDEMQEAFQMTSDSIGKDWRKLYHQLPFDPPRDIQQREQDLEVIDISNRRLDVYGFQLLAMKSLEKWRRLNSSASVDQLIATLRKIRKEQTASRIRKILASPRSPMATGRS